MLTVRLLAHVMGPFPKMANTLAELVSKASVELKVMLEKLVKLTLEPPSKVSAALLPITSAPPPALSTEEEAFHVSVVPVTVRPTPVMFQTEPAEGIMLAFHEADPLPPFRVMLDAFKVTGR